MQADKEERKGALIKVFADWLVFDVFKMAPDMLLTEALHFFIYDTIKIFLLLTVIIFVVSIVRSFFPPEKIQAILSHEKKYIGNIIAAVLGIITPFCTCSAIPLFLGFINVGVPLGVTFSFLVSSPMVNEVALVMLWGLFWLEDRAYLYRQRPWDCHYLRHYYRGAEYRASFRKDTV